MPQGLAFPTEAFPTQTLFPATEDYGHYEELPGQPGEPLFPEHPLEPDSFPEGGPPGRPKAGAGVPDFLPSAQRALYLRIQQKQQEEERARRLAESSKQDRENEEGMCPPAGAQPALCRDEGGTPRLGAVSENSLAERPCSGLLLHAEEIEARAAPLYLGFRKLLTQWRRVVGWFLA